MQDEQRDLAKTIRVSGSILLSTVSNFLDFFKMEAGKSLDVVRTEVDLEVCCLLHITSGFYHMSLKAARAAHSKSWKSTV